MSVYDGGVAATDVADSSGCGVQRARARALSARAAFAAWMCARSRHSLSLKHGHVTRLGGGTKRDRGPCSGSSKVPARPRLNSRSILRAQTSPLTVSCIHAARLIPLPLRDVE